MYRFICRLNASTNEIIVGLSDIGVSAVSVKAVETLVLLYFVTLYVCDRCYRLYMLSNVFLNLDLESVIQVWLIDWLMFAMRLDTHFAVIDLSFKQDECRKYDGLLRKMFGKFL